MTGTRQLLLSVLARNMCFLSPDHESAGRRPAILTNSVKRIFKYKILARIESVLVIYRNK